MAHTDGASTCRTSMSAQPRAGPLETCDLEVVGSTIQHTGPPQPGLEMLPIEIIQSTLQLLPKSTLLRLLTVNKRLSSIAQDLLNRVILLYPQLLDGFESMLEAKTQDQRASYFKKIQSLSLRADPFMSVDDDFLPQLLSMSSPMTLRTLTLQFRSYSEDLSDLLQAVDLRFLQSLTLVISEETPFTFIAKLLGRSALSLTHLKLDTAGMKLPSRAPATKLQLPHLKSLVYFTPLVNTARADGYLWIEELVSHSPALKSVDLVTNKYVAPAFVLRLFKCFGHRLQNLSLATKTCTNMIYGSHNQDKFADVSQSIVTLKLDSDKSRLPEETRRLYTLLPQLFPALKSLTLESTDVISIATILAILSRQKQNPSLPQLKFLDVCVRRPAPWGDMKVREYYDNVLTSLVETLQLREIEYIIIKGRR